MTKVKCLLSKDGLKRTRDTVHIPMTKSLRLSEDEFDDNGTLDETWNESLGLGKPPGRG